MNLKQMRKAYRDTFNAGWNRRGRRYNVFYKCRCAFVYLQARQALRYCRVHGADIDGAVHCEFRDDVIEGEYGGGPVVDRLTLAASAIHDAILRAREQKEWGR